MTCRSARLSSSWLEVRFSSARLGSVRFIRASGQIRFILVRLGALFSARFVSLSSVSGLSSCGTARHIFHRIWSEPLKTLLSVLGSEFDSRTQHKDSIRLESTLSSVNSRLGSARGSARLAIRGSVYLGSWIGLDLGITRAGRISSMLGSAELGARLGAQFGAKLGIGWGLRDSWFSFLFINWVRRSEPFWVEGIDEDRTRRKQSL